MDLDIQIQLPLNQFTLKINTTIKSPGAGVIGIFGPSGSGKTSLIKSIIGLNKNTMGVLSFNGKIWLNSSMKFCVPVYNRKIGYVPQESLLLPHKDVKGNLRMGFSRYSKIEDAEASFQVVVKTLNLTHLLDQNVEELSGGEKQRVSLGRALCSNPGLLILDEPLVSMDFNLKKVIRPYLTIIKEQFNLPMLMVSHDPEDLLELCDEVLVLEKGLLMGRGEASIILNEPSVMQPENPTKFKNLLRAKVHRSDAATTLVKIGESRDSVFITTPLLPDRNENDLIILKLPARDILLSLEPLKNISAQNVLKGKVSKVEHQHNHSLVTVLLHKANVSIVSEITKKSVEQLKLSLGDSVYLVIKTHSIRI